jgi:hypothetical protein
LRLWDLTTESLRQVLTCDVDNNYIRFVLNRKADIFSAWNGIHECIATDEEVTVKSRIKSLLDLIEVWFLCVNRCPQFAESAKLEVTHLRTLILQFVVTDEKTR